MVTYNKIWRHYFGRILGYLATGSLLIVGILNPVGGSSIDVFVGFFALGLVALPILKDNKPFLGVVFLAPLVIYSHVKGFDVMALFGVLTGFALAFSLVKFKAQRFAVFVLVAAFLTSAVATGGDLRTMLSRDLPLYTYNNDEGAFLKTYKMMKGNTGYYDAYRIAFMGKFASHVVPSDVWGWRLPTVFEIWRVIPGSGIGIYFLYLVLASAMIYGAYVVGKRYLDSSLALLPAYLVFPYLHFAVRDEILLLTEWWSVACFFLGLCLFVGRKHFFSILFLTLAVLIREVYVVPLGLMILYYGVRLKRRSVVFLIPVVAFAILLLYHVLSLSSYIDSWHSLLSARTVPTGVFFVAQTLSFGSWEYLLFSLRPFVFLLVLAVGACWYIYRGGRKDEAWIWFLGFLPFPVAFLKFGTVPYNDYWGIIYMPIVLVLAPLTIGYFRR